MQRPFKLFGLALLTFSLGLWPDAWAQPGSGGPGPAAPTAIPLDGGASLLLAAGVGLAVRRLRERCRY